MIRQTRNKMTTKKIDKILSAGSSSDSALQKLMRSVNEQAHLRRVILVTFPRSLSHGIKSVKKKGTTLHIECLNSAIATNLRFKSQDLIKRLSTLQDFENVAEIKPWVGRFTVKRSDT